MVGLIRLWILFYILSFASSLRAMSPENIFILAGQSNMAGRGGVEPDPKSDLFVWDGYIPPECQANPSIRRFNPNFEWEDANEPIFRDIDIGKTVGISPGMAFANQLLANDSSRIGVVGLVPYARGGTLISQWMKNPDSNSTFYDDLISRIMTSDKNGGTVRAFVWFQGESDASYYNTSIQYKDNLKTFFNDIRDDVKPRFLPIILVKIASYNMNLTNHMPEVREAEDAISRELPDVKIIDAMELVKSDGEGFNKDRKHLNTTNEIKLGKWMADTYLSYYSQLL